VIPIEGRIAIGLDEFMLRFGHLSVLAHVAVAWGSSKLEQNFGEFITRPTVVDPAANYRVAAYLSAKNLCRDPARPAGETRRPNKYRYPGLELFRVELARPESLAGVRSLEGEEVTVWWEDFCLSSPELESSVGGITVDAKSGSSTGASHIIDWGLILGLMNRDMSPSVECQLLARLRPDHMDSPRVNPYLLSTDDRTIFGYLLLRRDLDVFVRFAAEILHAQAPIGKTAGALLFGAAIKTLSEDLDRQRNRQQRVQFRISEQIKELKRAQRKKRDAPLGSSSTAWHRASSRLESYVDLGLLTKRGGGQSARFRYIYYPTALMKAAYESILIADSGQQWLEGAFIDFFGGTGKNVGVLELAELQALLHPLIRKLGRPIKLLPIEALSIGLCLQGRTIGANISIGGARKSLESLARAAPRVARLSRGAIGERAEFISIDIDKF
jgi:hypothetical protein